MSGGKRRRKRGSKPKPKPKRTSAKTPNEADMLVQTMQALVDGGIAHALGIVILRDEGELSADLKNDHDQRLGRVLGTLLTADDCEYLLPGLADKLEQLATMARERYEKSGWRVSRRFTDAPAAGGTPN